MTLDKNTTADECISRAESCGLSIDNHIYTDHYSEIKITDGSHDQVTIDINDNYIKDAAFYIHENGYLIEYEKKGTITDDGYTSDYYYTVGNGFSYQEGITQRFDLSDVIGAFEYAYTLEKKSY
jgi:hypothetical protein